LEGNLIKSFGDRLTFEDGVYYAYPTPETLASTTVERLRGCGLTLRKAEYIRDVSQVIVNGELDLEKLRKYEDTTRIIRELCQIRGVGVWTAELTAVRGMQKFNAMPAEDVGLRRSISHFYCNDRRISAGEAREIAEKWGKWKGLAGFYLEIAERLGVES
jgi:DNA-3-methyladenine glycosylase II